MREDLIEALGAIADGMRDAGEHEDAAILDRAADALEAAREDAWRPIEFEPPHNRKKDSFGTEYLIHPPTSGGDRTAFYGRRLGGAACWYRYGAPVRGVTHWRPLPAPPAIDQARGKGVAE